MIAALGAAASTRRPWRPNIVLISVDTLNPSLLRAYSSQAAALPAFDGLAGDAAVFERAYSTAPWTLPAHASLMTGRYPDRHGATDMRRGIAKSCTTLAQALRAAGYRTLAYTDSAFVDGDYGFSRGFERYDDHGERDDWPSGGIPRDGKPDLKHKHLYDRALQFLAQRTAADTPFFLFVHTYKVHDYFLTRPPGVTRHGRLIAYADCLKGYEPCPLYDFKVLHERYRRAAAQLDPALGRLLQATSRNTLVVFVSDHGEGFDLQRGRIHHGGRLHADLIHVPLMVRGPGITPRRVEDPVSLVDVMPTLLELLEIPVPPGLDGRSFVPALRGHRIEPRPLLAMEYYYRWRSGRREIADAVRAEPFSVAVVDGKSWYLRGADAEEQVYDTDADPAQDHSLAASLPDPVRRLVAARMAGPKPEEAAPLDDAVQERLKAIGYVE